MEQLEGETITYVETPTQDKWKLVPLFKKSVTGNVRMWQIGYNGVLTIVFGDVTGKKQVDQREITLNSSGRDIQTQALLEARGRYKDKYFEGYRPTDDTNKLGTSERVISPMLANEYWNGGYNQDRQKNITTKVTKWPVSCMPKLDGIRCLSYKHYSEVNNDEIIEMRSRENRDFVYTPNHFKHIREELSKFFMYLPEGTILDGELYNHDIDFNLIVSLVKTKKLVPPRHNEIHYYIFDIIESTNGTFNYRYNVLIQAYNSFIMDGNTITSFCIVPCTIAYNHQDIVSLHQTYVSNGYEGLIIRKIVGDNPSSDEIKQSQYRCTRCNNLLKFKHFIDEEGTIIGVEEGTGGEQGCAIFLIVDCRNNQLRIRPRGSLEQRKDWFNNPHKVTGKKYTFRYFELTPDQIPRFPTGKGFRDYE